MAHVGFPDKAQTWSPFAHDPITDPFNKGIEFNESINLQNMDFLSLFASARLVWVNPANITRNND